MKNIQIPEADNEKTPQEQHHIVVEFMKKIENLEENEIRSSYHFHPLLGAMRCSELRVSKNKDGALKYEKEMPFSEEEYQTLTKEEFEEEVRDINKQLREKEQEREETEKHNKKMEDIGYIERIRLCTGPTYYWNRKYQQQLFNTLQKHEIETIQAIPQYVENQVLLTTRNQGLANIEKKADHRETIILNFLEKREKTVEKRRIKEEEIGRIEAIFLQGHIDNPELFYRFEQLKQKNRTEQVKRVYRYGRECGNYKEISENAEVSDYIDGDFIRVIYNYICHGEGSIPDLGVTEEEFREKILHSYKKRMGIKMLNGRRHFNDKYEYTPEKMKELLHLTDEDLSHLRNQAKEILTEIYWEDLENNPLEKKMMVSSSDSHKRVGVPSGKVFGYMNPRGNFFWRRKQAGIETINQLWKATPEFNEKVKAFCKQQIAHGIQKILNRERITTLDKGDHHTQKLSYKRYIKEIVEFIDDFFFVLQQIDPQEAEATGWEQKKETYSKEYADFFKNTFIQTRLKEALITPPENWEEVITQAIEHSKAKLYQLFFAKIKRHLTMPPSYNPISNHRAKLYIHQAMFKTGSAPALVKAYPKKKQRGKIYQQCVQEICKQLIQEIEEKLLTTEEFDDGSIKESFMLAPLFYLYKEYQGKEEFGVNVTKIQERYYERIMNNFKTTCTKNLKKIQNSLKNTKNPKSPLELYWILSASVRETHRYTWYFMHTPREQIATEQTAGEQVATGKESSIKVNLYHEYDENVKTSLPPEIQETYQQFFDQIDGFRKEILQRILQLRSQQNFGGRIKRIAEDHLLKEFWTTMITNEQHIEYILGILDTILAEIVLQDLSQQFEWGNFLMKDREILKEFIKESLITLSQQKHLLGSFLKFLP